LAWVQTATKHRIPDWVTPSFVIFNTGHSDARGSASESPDVKNYKWRRNPVWHTMLYSCTHMATVGVKGLTNMSHRWPWLPSLCDSVIGLQSSHRPLSLN